jgi:hypothetical protein
MAPLCSSNEGSTHRKCPGVDTRSVRRASGLLETGFQVTRRAPDPSAEGNVPKIRLCRHRHIC